MECHREALYSYEQEKKKKDPREKKKKKEKLPSTGRLGKKKCLKLRKKKINFDSN